MRRRRERSAPEEAQEGALSARGEGGGKERSAPEEEEEGALSAEGGGGAAAHCAPHSKPHAPQRPALYGFYVFRSLTSWACSPSKQLASPTTPK